MTRAESDDQEIEGSKRSPITLNVSVSRERAHSEGSALNA